MKGKKRKNWGIASAIVVLALLILVFSAQTEQGFVDDLVAFQETDTVKYQISVSGDALVQNPSGSGCITVTEYLQQVYGENVEITNDKEFYVDGMRYNFIFSGATLSGSNVEAWKYVVFKQGFSIDTVEKHQSHVRTYAGTTSEIKATFGLQERAIGGECNPESVLIIVSKYEIIDTSEEEPVEEEVVEEPQEPETQDPVIEEQLEQLGIMGIIGIIVGSLVLIYLILLIIKKRKKELKGGRK